MFERLKLHLSRYETFVIADPRDNSITFSKALAKMLELDSLSEAKVFAFSFEKKDRRKSFGFTLNPKFEQETQLSDIQYNSKHKCVGFECLNPSVNRIYYDYNIKHFKPCKFTIEKRFVKERNLTYYEICRPQINK